MELWIRSQDKERLIKPIDFYIEETIDYVNKHSEFDIYALNFANDDIRIGTYKTKERALEVLDEIQKILQPKGMIKFGGILDAESQKKVSEMLDNKYLIFDNNVELLKQVDTYVYEMPKE